MSSNEQTKQNRKVRLEVHFPSGKANKTIEFEPKTSAEKVKALVDEKVQGAIGRNSLNGISLLYKDSRQDKALFQPDAYHEDPDSFHDDTWELFVEINDEEKEPASKRFRVGGFGEAAFTVLQLKQWTKENTCKAPALPQTYASKLLHRESACDIVKGYIDDVHSKKQFEDNKCPLLGCSGMKGIGKSTMLVHSARHLVPAGANALYLTFNGGGARKTEFMASLAAQHGGTQNLAVAFGHMMLAACGVPLHMVLQLNFENCLDVYRQLVNLKSDSLVVVFVDEIGDLGNDQGLETMKALMGEVDRYPGQLAFVFAHIQQDILNRGATQSGRRVIPLWLPALNISAWKQVVGAEWQIAANNHPGIHQLLLACCGHPRSLVNGLPEALKKVPNLLDHPRECSLVLAMNEIVNMCKFSDFTAAYLTNIVPQWFDFVVKMDTEVLARDGILLKVKDEKSAEVVEFLQPLVLHHWASTNCMQHSIPFHLQQAYAADAIVGHNTEKRMEDIMYNYEALLKKSVAGKLFTLQGFYCSEHTGGNFYNRTVRAPLPPQVNLVQEVDNFQNLEKVWGYLEQGFIVVSKARGEVGIEYLSPFVCEHSAQLVVAAVQCKFVQSSCNWAEMGDKMEKAIAPLEKKGMVVFPIFYTTVDQNSLCNTTYSNSNGIYFTESDLFNFTKKMGILRLHVTKMGEKLQQRHPWLMQSFGTTR